MATSVWSTGDKNAWVANIMGVINKNMQLPAPPAGGPGMFRCGAPGFMKSIMQKSGFKNIQEQTVSGKVLYAGFDEMWQMMNEVAAPVVGALSKADEALKQKIKGQAEKQSEQYLTDKGLELDYESLVISGNK